MSGLPEFTAMGLDASKFRKAKANEYHGPCPICGGQDRFRVHTDKPFPQWYTVCREGTGCNWKGWADQLAPHLRQPLTIEQRTEYAAKMRAQEQAEAERRYKILDQFNAQELWEAYHRKMTAENTAWWEKQGLPIDAQNYWHLGYTTTTSWGGAYSIPYFSQDWKPVNLQYRLTNPPDASDKYRWGGLGYSSFFTAHPDKKQADEVIICEGAKKAMVTAYHVADEHMQVYAVPSKSDTANISDAVKECGRVWVILDPDAEANARGLACDIGKQAVVVTLTEKIDDLITKYGMKMSDLRKYMRQFARLS